MFVDALMAGKAGLRRFSKLRGFMALLTGHFAMTPQQFKFELVMIEDDRLPILRRMTALALLSEDALVLVLVLVTPDAGRGRRFEVIGGVAFFTGHRRMLPLQRESCPGMIEADLFPGLRIMTALAGLAQRPLVLILFEMTGITIVGGIAVFRFLMAAIAFRRLMFTD